jgi:hypothetical protein
VQTVENFFDYGTQFSFRYNSEYVTYCSSSLRFFFVSIAAFLVKEKYAVMSMKDHRPSAIFTVSLAIPPPGTSKFTALH